MTYEEFKTEIKNRIVSYLPPSCGEWKAELHDTYKVNVKLDALTVIPPEKKADRIQPRPVFYLQDFYEMYQAGYSQPWILRYLADKIVNTPVPQELQNMDCGMEKFRDCTVFQVINAERNRELLKTLPHRRFLDLAVIYRILMMDENEEYSSMLVTKDVMKSWNLREGDLYEQAKRCTAEVLPFLLRSLEDFFPEAAGRKSGAGRSMLVLSNAQMQFGAAAMLYPDLLEMAAEEIGGSYAVLPGSMHELYLVKGTPEDVRVWKSVVRSANRELVNPADFLSDSIYYYDAEEKTINILW